MQAMPARWGRCGQLTSRRSAHTWLVVQDLPFAFGDWG